MFTSLDKLDIVVDTPEGRLVVQTDHRSADEIEATLDLSLVLGALRARSGLLWPGMIGVRFVSPTPPPPGYAAFLQRFGAEVEVTGGASLPPRPDPETARAELEAAWLRLGAALFAEYGLPTSLDGLRQIEAHLRDEADSSGVPEGGEDVESWPRALRLGGAAALVLRTLHGGRLGLDDELVGPINAAWWIDGTRINVFDRASHFLTDEPGIPPSALAVLESERDVDGELMLSLRPPGWPGQSLALTVPILPTVSDAEHPTLPLLAIVLDRPQSTQTLPKDTPAADIEGLRAQAVANNRKRPFTTERLDLQGQPVLVVTGHYFAAERLFDEEFMRGLHEQLASTTLLAAAPTKGLLFIAPADADPRRASAVLDAVARGQHGRTVVTDRLSPQVLIVREGRVVGLVQVGTEEAPAAKAPAPEAKPAKKKGLWSRWFGGDGEA